MLQRLGIRGKLLAVVAVPILVLIVAAGVITLGSVQDLNAARNAEQLIDTLDRARDLQAGLQDERALAANFVHSVQNAESARRDAFALTEDALEDIAVRLAEPDIQNPQEIQDAIDAALSRSGNQVLAAERALALGEPTEESGGWVVFPSEDEIAAMQSAYAEVVAEIDAIIESLPGDTNLNVSLAALSFRVNAESERATELFTEPLEYQASMAQTNADVDRAIQAMVGSADALAETEENERAVAAILAGEEAIANLDQVRANVRSVNTGPASVTTYYTGIITTIVQSADEVAVAMADRGLVSILQAYGDLDALVENIKYEEVVIERLIRAGSFLPGEAGQVRTFTTRTDLSLLDAQSSTAAVSGMPEVPPFGASASDSLADANSFSSVRTQVLTGLDSSLFTARTADWNTQVSEELAVYEPLREEVWGTVRSQAGADAQAALVQTVITAIAVAAVVIISIVVALTIARTIIGPLRRLTTTATAVRQELPRLVARVAIPGETVDVTEVQIPVESRDEIGRLAEAFNGVNAATLDIAGEQAALRGSISEMFVNVARRDQVLLNRQLASIDEMERTEDNPETLTKLFALDHLATRMRRNSESLLVLAGIDTGRRLRRPMPLSDVIRTASSEIELYERVTLELDVDPHMLGHSALSTAHLIAELLENATVFSDPGTAVVVRTAQEGDNYVVEVEDSGIGMTDKELERANERIGSTSASEILGAQRLGLFVVGRIARRVGATVTLSSEEGKGTVARVLLPKAAFTADDDAPASGTQASTVDEKSHAPSALTRHNLADEIMDTPAQMPAGVDAYTPTAIEAGTSLTGRGGADQSGSDQQSIEDLIAADAANAPVAEPADPAALTDGASAAGLPTRRRRDNAPQADAGGEQSQIVGLPARATDAQLSALAAEGEEGFKPTVPAAEVAPQTAEQRASMFRGFRARGGADQAPPAGESAPGAERDDDNQGVPVDSSTASALPVRTPSRVEPPAPPAEPTPSPSTRDAGMAAAGAAGAAAFFARRSRDENVREGSGADLPPALRQEPSADSPLEMELPQLVAEDDEPTQPVAAESAEPMVPEPPVFRMPKVDSGSALTPESQAAPASASVEPVAPSSGQDFDVPGLEDDQFVVPGFADDDVESQPQPTSYATSEVAPESPYGGVEQVSYESEQVPTSAPSAPGFLDANPYAQPQQQYEQPQETYEQFQAADAPATYEPQAADGHGEVAQADPAGWGATQAAEPSTPVGLDQPAPDSAPAPASAPEPFEGAGSPRAERSNPNLDALLQTAADNETRQRPGFFSRLFGRGRHADAEIAGAAATQWADVGDDQAAPASAPSAPLSFTPVSQQAPVASPPESAYTAQPEVTHAPEPVQPPAQPPVSASAPAAPASAPAWEPAPQSFAPEPQSQPSAPEAPAWQSAPAAPAAQPTAFQPAPAWEPAAAPSAPQPQQFSPTPELEPAGTQATYTPDQLADATGWQAAGASALQAAQPDIATSYQPIIQPDESGGGSDADLTSAVFSEFSSLAAERPKVEKTRAGLERRRPSNAKPVEVKPIEDTPEIVPVKRDADAIRDRFSSFYSGTQRARDDVAVFDSRAHASEVSDT